MRPNQIKQILESHGHQCRILSGRVVASSESVAHGVLHVELVDLTGISLCNLKTWMGC